MRIPLSLESISFGSIRFVILAVTPTERGNLAAVGI